MLFSAGKYAEVRGLRSGSAPAPAAKPSPKRKLNILMPKKGAMLRFNEWMWKELREGGQLHRYLAQEQAQRDARARKAARLMDGKKPNPKSDCKLLYAIPMRDAMRLEQDRPGFLEDDWNLRWLKRKNPDLPIFV